MLTDAISEAERKLPDGTTIRYNKEGLSVVAKTNPKAREILDRTSARLLATELNKQFNLEGVFAEAVPELKDLIGIHPFRLGAEETYFGFSDGVALAVTKGEPHPRVPAGLSVWLLTESGKDLLRFIPWQTQDGYVEKFRDGIRKLNNWGSRIGKISDYSNPKFEETN
jgi:hypothetical protein